MLTRMHAHRRHTHTHSHAHIHTALTHTYTHTHAYTQACTQRQTPIHTQKHTQTHTHEHRDRHTCIHTDTKHGYADKRGRESPSSPMPLTTVPPPFTGHHEPPRNQFLSLNPRFWSWRSQVGHASGISKVLLADVTHPGLRATPWVLAQPTLPVSDGLGRSCPHLSRPGLPEAPEGAP